jgi:hypothetical protein
MSGNLVGALILNETGLSSCTGASFSICRKAQRENGFTELSALSIARPESDNGRLALFLSALWCPALNRALREKQPSLTRSRSNHHKRE